MNEVLGTRSRIKWSMQDRDDWVALYRESGLSVEDFCRLNDFPKAKLAYWLDSLEGPAENDFVEVAREALPAPVVHQPVVTAAAPTPVPSAPVAVAPVAAAAVALQLPSGMRIEIPVGLDMGWFNGLLQSIVAAKV